MTKRTFIITVLLAVCLPAFGQHLGLSFQEAEEQGIVIKELDSIYKSAIHADTAQAVFKTEEEQRAMFEAYQKLLQDFGGFLSNHDFIWDKSTRCFNRIYFDTDGTIDYFLFNFLEDEPDKLSDEKQKEFQRLLNLFIADYKIPLTAKSKFAQCSPTRYAPR